MDTQRKGSIIGVLVLLCHSCIKISTNFLQIQVNISFQSMRSNPPVRSSLLMQWFRSWNSECALIVVIISPPRLACTLQPALRLRNFKMTGMEWIYVCVYAIVRTEDFLGQKKKPAGHLGIFSRILVAYCLVSFPLKGQLTNEEPC